jgi:protein-disulfide isomerase
VNEDSRVVLGIGVLTVLILAILLIFGSKSGKTEPGEKVDTSTLVRDGSPRRGEASAQVTIVEFGDFQCPSCGAEYPIIKKLLSEYLGKVQLVYRHFPLPGHPHARIAAQAAEAADDQGKFWEMHDKLFEKQTEWSASDKPIDFFITYAKELGLDESAFRSAVEENKNGEFVQEDVRQGDKLGVNATPTLYINGEKIESEMGYPQLKDKIDSILNASPPAPSP